MAHACVVTETPSDYSLDYGVEYGRRLAEATGLQPVTLPALGPSARMSADLPTVAATLADDRPLPPLARMSVERPTPGGASTAEVASVVVPYGSYTDARQLEEASSLAFGDGWHICYCEAHPPRPPPRPPPSPPPSPPPPSPPPSSPPPPPPSPPHILVVLQGEPSTQPPFATDDDQSIGVWVGVPYVIEYAGGHALAPGDVAYWTIHDHPHTSALDDYDGALDACEAERRRAAEPGAAALVGGVVVADGGGATVVRDNVFGDNGNSSLCVLRASDGATEAHTHISAFSFFQPPSPPPPSPPSPPPPIPPSPPPPSLPSATVAAAALPSATLAAAALATPTLAAAAQPAAAQPAVAAAAEPLPSAAVAPAALSAAAQPAAAARRRRARRRPARRRPARRRPRRRQASLRRSRPAPGAAPAPTAERRPTGPTRSWPVARRERRPRTRASSPRPRATTRSTTASSTDAGSRRRPGSSR